MAHYFFLVSLHEIRSPQGYTSNKSQMFEKNLVSKENEKPSFLGHFRGVCTFSQELLIKFSELFVLEQSLVPF